MTLNNDNALHGKIITCIGAGNMAFSLLNGLLGAGHPGGSLRAADVLRTQLERYAPLGITTYSDNAQAIAKADIVVLAVKPQVLQKVLAELPLARHQLLISIAAGIPIRTLEANSPPQQSVVRCMPNTPALVGAGISALFGNGSVSADHRAQVETLLRSVGKVIWVEDERQLDAVTAVSGSGPAYFFYVMEAMVRAGMELGLSREAATRLTIETAYGAALLARESDQDPATLRTNVTSPGGTTERALAIMNDAGVADAIVRALHGAAGRSAELAKEF